MHHCSPRRPAGGVAGRGELDDCTQMHKYTVSTGAPLVSGVSCPPAPWSTKTARCAMPLRVIAAVFAWLSMFTRSTALAPLLTKYSKCLRVDLKRLCGIPKPHPENASEKGPVAYYYSRPLLPVAWGTNIARLPCPAPPHVGFYPTGTHMHVQRVARCSVRLLRERWHR